MFPSLHSAGSPSSFGPTNPTAPLSKGLWVRRKKNDVPHEEHVCPGKVYYEMRTQEISTGRAYLFSPFFRWILSSIEPYLPDAP